MRSARAHAVTVFCVLAGIAACSLTVPFSDYSNEFGRCDGGCCDASDCGQADADILGDAHNCGALGHDCLGGLCVEGVCQPVAIAVGQNYPADLAVDATGVYWLNGGIETGDVMMAPPNGGPRVLVKQEPRPGRIALDMTNVYWTNMDGTVMTVSKSCDPPCQPVRVASGQDTPGGVAVDDTFVYWTRSGATGAVVRKPKALAECDATACEPLMPNLYNPLVVAVDATGVFWSTGGSDTNLDGSIQGMTKGGAIQTYAEDQPWPAWIAIDEAAVYWSVYQGTGVMSAPRVGGSWSVIASDVQAGGVAVDPDFVYFGGNGAIWRVRRNGTSLQQLARDQTSPFAIAVDATTVYWTDEIGGTVMKLAK